MGGASGSYKVDVECRLSGVHGEKTLETSSDGQLHGLGRVAPSERVTSAALSSFSAPVEKKDAPTALYCHTACVNQSAGQSARHGRSKRNRDRVRGRLAFFSRRPATCQGSQCSASSLLPLLAFTPIRTHRSSRTPYSHARNPSRTQSHLSTFTVFRQSSLKTFFGASVCARKLRRTYARPFLLHHQRSAHHHNHPCNRRINRPPSWSGNAICPSARTRCLRPLKVLLVCTPAHRAHRVTATNNIAQRRSSSKGVA